MKRREPLTNTQLLMSIAIGIFVIMYGAAMIGLGWIATLARLYLMYKGITNALNGRKEPLPYIGTLGDK